MGKLDGKIALITGATSGMALATARLFVREGAEVVITGRRQEKLDDAIADIGDRAVGVQADSANLADLDRVYDTVRDRHGRLDVLFASAGVGELDKPLEAVTEEGFDATFGVNTRGTLFTVQKALPLMREGGSIILNGTVGINKGFAGTGVYGASKAAVRSFARTWTAELARKQIRVNVLSPGSIIDTGSLEGMAEEQKATFRAIIPMGDFGLSRQIATVALFLASEDSSYVTGVELAVDGGMAQV